MDAARNFLDAALKGDYKHASVYMLKDSANLEYLNVSKEATKLKPRCKGKIKGGFSSFF